jgi:hypothetical protein
MADIRPCDPTEEVVQFTVNHPRFVA